MDSPDLSKASLEELARLHDWMVPPSRKEELAEYRRSLRRAEVKKADQAAKALLGKDRYFDPRGFVPQKGSRPHTSGGGAAPGSTSGSGAVRYGPRGGRYTEEVTKSGRRYRRYF